MHRREDDSGETFGFPTSYKVLIWMCVVGGVCLSAWAAYGSVTVPEPGERRAATAVAVLFGIAIPYLLKIAVARLPEKIHTDNRAVTHEAPDGTLTTLPWDEITRVIDRPFLQCLELRGDDGLTTIRIENQLERFDRLREIVLERSGWVDQEAAADLPATFTRTSFYLIVAIVVALVFVGVGLAAIYEGTILGLLVIPLGLLMFLDWIVIRVDRSGITFRNLLWKRRIPIDQIEKVHMETSHPGHGNALSAVMIRLRSGKVRRIVAVRGGSLELYRTLLAAIEPES
jgi:hypothetical protein